MLLWRIAGCERRGVDETLDAGIGATRPGCRMTMRLFKVKERGGTDVPSA